MVIAATNNRLPSPQTDVVKNRLRQLTDADRERFRNVYHYRWLRSTLRSTGTVNIFWSLLTIWLALAVNLTVFRYFQFVGGLMTLLVSIWAVVSTSVRQLRVFVGLLILIGIYNFVVAFYFGRYGVSLLPLIFGITQFWSAYRFYRLSQYFQLKAPSRPSDVDDRAYDNVWAALKQADPATDAELIEFSLLRRRWRGWLLKDFAVVVPMQRKVVLFVPQTDAQLSPNVGKLGKKKRFRVEARFADIKTWGTIKRADFDCYAAWKQNHNPGVTPEMLMLVGDGKIDWLPFHNLPLIIRIVLLLVLLGFLFCAALIVSALFQYHQFGL